MRFRRTVLAAMLVAALACARGGGARRAESTAAGTRVGDTRLAPANDTTFAALQARGATAMGVDQYTSTHHFDELPNGGRIVLERDVADSAEVATIRAHLRSVAAAFARGDFSSPAFVHGHPMPGTAEMAARRSAITYTYADRPRGGEVRITSGDSAAVAAIHAFMRAQRMEHHAAGMASREGQR